MVRPLCLCSSTLVGRYKILRRRGSTRLPSGLQKRRCCSESKERSTPRLSSLEEVRWTAILLVSERVTLAPWCLLSCVQSGLYMVQPARMSVWPS